MAVSPIGPEAGDIYATNWQRHAVGDRPDHQPRRRHDHPAGRQQHRAPVRDLAVSPTGRRPATSTPAVYGGDANSPGTLWVISPTTNSVTATIPLSNPDVAGVAVSNTGSDVYVLTNASTAGIRGQQPHRCNGGCDRPHHQPGDEHHRPPGHQPGRHGDQRRRPPGRRPLHRARISPLRPSPPGALVTDTVTVVNPTTDSIDTITLPHLDVAGPIAVSDSGPTAGDVYVDVAVPDVTTATGFTPAVDVINPATNAITATIPLDSDVVAACSGPCDIAVSPIGAYAGDVFVTGQVASGEGTVFVINVTTDTVVDSFPVASGPDTTVADGLAVSDTGLEAGEIYTANSLVVSGGSLEPTTVSVLNPTTEGVPG